MSEYFEDESVKLPSLWRVKAKSYFWTLLFGAVFFTAFFSIRNHINVDLGSLMQPGDARMTVVWLLTVSFSLAFNKVYFLFNPEVFQSNTQMLRLNSKKLDKIYSKVSKNESDIKEMRDIIITYADQVPDFKPFPEVDLEAKL